MKPPAPVPRPPGLRAQARPPGVSTSPGGCHGCRLPSDDAEHDHEVLSVSPEPPVTRQAAAPKASPAPVPWAPTALALVGTVQPAGPRELSLSAAHRSQGPGGQEGHSIILA